MSFPFNTGVPATGSSPAQNYGAMQQNNVSSQAILAVDHYTYGNTIGGQHQKCTFPEIIPVPAAPAPGGAVLYPSAGQANPAIAQLSVNNSQVTLIPTVIRAYGVISRYASGPYPRDINMLNSFNVDLSAGQSQQTNNSTFRIILLPNTVANTNAGVIINASTLIVPTSTTAISTYVWNSPTELIINFTSLPNPGFVTFMILQV